LTEVKKFGLLFGTICSGVALYVFLTGGDVWLWFVFAAAFFFFTGLFAQRVLRPIHAAWMRFAHALAWVNTRILLGLFFYLVMTPLGVIMRLAGKDFLDEKIDRSASTYWIKREEQPLDRTRYERLF